MADIFERIVLPVADPEDAAATCAALTSHDVGSVLAIHVVEKAGGAPDKASVEQRRAYAEEIFDVVEDLLADAMPVETEVAYGTDVAETIFHVADDYDATAIVMSPRGGSRWIRLLTGDVALSLVTDSDRPVIVLPDVEKDGGGTDGGNGRDNADSDDAEGDR